MKYIIESNDVIGYTPKYAMLFGDGYMIQPLEDLEEFNSDYINEHYGSLQDEAYQRGLDDAWECMKKIAFLEKPRDMRDFFGHTTFGGILTGYTATEAIEKLKAYEEKQKADDEIKVGDEVEVMERGIKFFVTKIYEEEGTVGGLNKDGEVRYWSRSLVKRTGNHLDIPKILKEMQT